MVLADLLDRGWSDPGVSLLRAVHEYGAATGATGAQLQRGPAERSADAARSTLFIQCPEYNFLSCRARSEADAAHDRASWRLAAHVARVEGPAGGSAYGGDCFPGALPGNPEDTVRRRSARGDGCGAGGEVRGSAIDVYSAAGGECDPS